MSVTRLESFVGLLSQLKYAIVESTLLNSNASFNIWFGTEQLFLSAQRTIAASDIAHHIVYGPLPSQFPGGVNIIVLYRTYAPAAPNPFAVELATIPHDSRPLSSLTDSLLRSALAKQAVIAESAASARVPPFAVTPVREPSLQHIQSQRRAAAAAARLVARHEHRQKQNAEIVAAVAEATASAVDAALRSREPDDTDDDSPETATPTRRSKSFNRKRRLFQK